MKRAGRNILLFVLLFTVSVRSRAQAYHFSQFYSTPLLNNPAFTGYTEGPYRVATNFRSQWIQGGTPYLTSSISADVSGLRKHIPSGDKAGAGIYFMNDQSLGSALQTNTLGISTAYHLSLDQFNDHTLGVGLQGIYSQRRIDYSKLSFESQFGSNGFDPSLPVGEPLNVRAKGYFDVNAGILYHFRHDYDGFFAGAAVYNTIRHKENMQGDDFNIPRRYTLLGGGYIAIGYDGTLYTSFNFMSQGKANDFTLGAAYGIQIGSQQNQEINFGVWHRWKDAIIPYVGYQLSGFQLGLSYDYTISGIKSAAEIKNAYELTLLYTAADKTEIKRLIPWY